MQQAARGSVSGRGGKAVPDRGHHRLLWPVFRSISGLIKFSFGPVALDVSLLSLVGVLVAYLIARSLF